MIVFLGDEGVKLSILGDEIFEVVLLMLPIIKVYVYKS
jgi:hypothetical protein